MIGEKITIGGEELSEYEASELLEMLIKHARQLAGKFHQLNRSEKFRRNWPDEYLYAEHEWRSHVEATLQVYAQGMSDPRVRDYDRRRMFLARLLWAQVEAAATELFPGNQLFPNTAAYEGDAYENKRIAEMFGTHAMSFAEVALQSKRFH